MSDEIINNMNNKKITNQFGVEFRHSTHNASGIWRKMGNASILTGTKCLNNRFPGPL